MEVEVLNQHPSGNDVYITRLRLGNVHIIRFRNNGRIKHVVDKDLEEKLSKPFYFHQHVKGNVTQVFFPEDDQPELVGLKKGNF